MMFLDRKLKRWVEAGLISETTSLEIANFENKGSKTNVLNGVLAIGALSIVVGIISIIAANWHIISKHIKLTANISWLVLLSSAIIKLDNGTLRYLREALILILFGSIIGSIALIGQIYHLESHPFKAVSLWLAIGSPIIFFSETKYGAYVWATLLTVCAFMGYDFFFPRIMFLETVDINLGYVPVLLFYSVMFLRKLNLSNGYFVKTTTLYSYLVLMSVTMILGSFRWRDETNDISYFHSTTILVLSLPLSWYFIRSFSKLAGFIFFLTIGFLEFPNMFVHGNLKVFGMIYFLLIWSMLAYLASKLNEKRIFEISCFILSLRIVVIYFEVFGSLLQTGIGLISSGAFILLVCYLWHSNKEKLWSLR